ncbi:hypothetical protein ACEN8K_28005 [Variovorax sp. CT11-76]
MGIALARALQRGHTLTLWNRTPSRAEALLGQGTVLAADARARPRSRPRSRACSARWPASSTACASSNRSSCRCGTSHE